MQEWVTHTVWKDPCRSWYRNNDTGRVNAVWPGSTLHFCQLLAHPRWEDFDISYVHKNPWASLGLGWTLNWKRNLDMSPYLSKESIDPLWLETISKNPDHGLPENLKTTAGIEQENAPVKEKSEIRVAESVASAAGPTQKEATEEKGPETRFGDPFEKSGDTAIPEAKHAKQNGVSNGPQGEQVGAEVVNGVVGTEPKVQEVVKPHVVTG